METRAPQTFGSWLQERRGPMAAMVMFAVVIVLRAPKLLFPGRFWAEDGTVFFMYGLTHSFAEALFAPHQGYFLLLPNAAGIAAAHVPLLWAPRVTSFFGLLAQCSPAAVILFTKISGLESSRLKTLALMVLLFVPADTEVYLNAANAQFLLCVATGLVLISQPGGAFDRWAKWLFLGLAALTGVVSTFLAPFFFWRWWRERKLDRLVQAMILAAGAIVQLAAIHAAAAQLKRPIHLSPDLMAGVFFAKLMVAPVTSYGNFSFQLETLRPVIEHNRALPLWIWAVTVIAGSIFFLLCGWSRSRTAIWLAAAGIWVAMLSIIGALGTDSFDLMGLAARYYYAPQVFCALAVLTAWTAGKKLPFLLKAISAGWLAIFFFMGLFNFVSGPTYLPEIFSGPAWPKQVKLWQASPGRPLFIWPGYLKLELPKKD